jgi:hypothetical protein
MYFKFTRSVYTKLRIDLGLVRTNLATLNLAKTYKLLIFGRCIIEARSKQTTVADRSGCIATVVDRVESWVCPSGLILRVDHGFSGHMLHLFEHNIYIAVIL